MALDRDLQLTLLTELSDVYPYNYDFNQDFEYNSQEREKALKNLYYLQSHGLVSEKVSINQIHLEVRLQLYLVHQRLLTKVWIF